MQIHEFKLGEGIQWVQSMDGVEVPIRGVVELVEPDKLTVRDTLGQFWQVKNEDEPVRVWD